MYKEFKKAINIIKDIGSTALLFMFILILWKISAYLERTITTKPYDNLETFVESIYCERNWCNVSFKYNVTNYYIVAETGSMQPVIQGNDYVICVNATPKLGDYVVTPYALHMVYSVEDGWILTKGLNNDVPDPYKLPISKVECVVAGILR